MHIAQPSAQPPHLDFLDDAARETRDDAVDPNRVCRREATWWRGESVSSEQHAASRKALQMTRVKHDVREMGKRRWWPARAQLQLVEVDQCSDKLFGERKMVQK